MSIKTGFVSGMKVEFDESNVIAGEREPRHDYHNVSMYAPWGLVYQRVRKTNIKNKKGEMMYPPAAVIA